MERIPIDILKYHDIFNLPEGEVLAANFKEGSPGYNEKLIGWLYTSHGNGTIRCDDATQTLPNATHYIDIHQFKPTE